MGLGGTGLEVVSHALELGGGEGGEMMLGVDAEVECDDSCDDGD
jgi:hypothetical protein